MKNVRVLVVDDSAFMRRAVSDLIESNPELTVVGIARNGIDAIDKVQRFQPDVVTMDVDMPEMDGITAIVQIMRDCPVPVVMLSARTSQGAEVTLRALEAGAVDFFVKHELLNRINDAATAADFHERLKAAATAKVRGKVQLPAETPTPVQRVTAPVQVRTAATKSDIDVVIIGCSTGGPAALQSILPRMPSQFPVPVLVLQHMPPGFTKPLAQRFDSTCHLRVKEAVAGETLQKGTIYVAPSGLQTLMQRTASGEVALNLTEMATMETRYRPSVDVTLSSAAPVYKGKMLAVILTGMGTDGLRGCKLVKQYGGKVIAEAEESCVVYGMPRAVANAGYADAQVHLNDIYTQIAAMV